MVQRRSKAPGLWRVLQWLRSPSSSTSCVQFSLQQVSPFDPEFQDPFPPITGTFDFCLLFLPFRGTTNKQAEKSGACSTPDSLQNSPLTLTFGFYPWEHNNVSKIPGCKKSKHLL